MVDIYEAEHLCDLFLSERWKDHFRSLSDITKFNLSIFSETGEPIFSTEKHSSVCRGLRSSPDFRLKCDTYCRNIITSAVTKDSPITYKCYANIMSFAIPVKHLGETAVILGQGSFSSYEDFCGFTQQLSPDDIDDFLTTVTEPLRFTSADKAADACYFIDSSINQLLKSIEESIALKRKITSVKDLMGLWGIIDRGQPEVLYGHIAASLYSLLDLKDVRGFFLNAEQGIYVCLYSSRGISGIVETFKIREDDIIVQKLRDGAPFVSLPESSKITGNNLLKNRKDFYFFPVVINMKLEGILGVFDASLQKSDIDIIMAFCKYTAIAIENQRLQYGLYRKIDRFGALSELARDITCIPNYEALLKAILDKSADLLNAEQGSLMVLDHKTEMLLLEARKGMSNKIAERLKIQKGEGIAGKVAESGTPFLVKDIENDPRINQKNRPRYKTSSLVSTPIKIEDRIIGVLNLSDKTTGEAFDEEDLELIQSFAAHAAVVMEKRMCERQVEDLRKLSITDHLTGLLNRRYLYDRLEEEVLRSQRHSRPLSLIMLDIDGFKDYNDMFGHIKGDKALKTIVDAMINSVRSIDIVCRYGGDEFVIILPETEKTEAIVIAKRLRSDIAKLDLQTEDTAGQRKVINLTASIGLVSYPEGGNTVKLLLEHVDMALYFAKNKGRNRIEVFS